MAALTVLPSCGGDGPSSTPPIAAAPTPTPTPPPPPARPILNIQEFLATCPAGDPASLQIRRDIRIRRNGALVGEIPCTEPATAMPIAQWTDELIIMQGLRALYHMDAGLTGHLPFTTGSAYRWFVSRVGGLNTVDTATSNSCCTTIDGTRHITLTPGDEFNRNYDRNWDGLSSNIALYLHEARHADGFGHVSCCGITGGCDQTYDETNLSPYGMQYWIYRAWLDGAINVGVGCLERAEVRRIAQYQVGAANIYPDRFCDRKPLRLNLPAAPGGECRQ